MAAGLTALDVLAMALIFGAVGAITGWLGGKGATLGFAVRVDRMEHFVLQILNRAKGAAGNQRIQEYRGKASAADREAEELAARLAFGGPAGARRFMTRIGRPIRTAADAAEEAAMEEIEAEKQKARAKDGA